MNNSKETARLALLRAEEIRAERDRAKLANRARRGANIVWKNFIHKLQDLNFEGSFTMKRLAAAFLAAIVVLSVTPFSVFADDGIENETETEITEKTPLEEAQDNFNTSKKEFEEKKDEAEGSGEAYSEEKKGYDEELDEYNKAKEEYNKKVEEGNSDIESFNSDVEDFEERAGAFYSDYDEYVEKQAAWELEFQAYMDSLEELYHDEDAYNAAVEEYNRLMALREALDEEREALNDRGTALNIEIQSLYDRRDAIDTAWDNIKDDMNDLNNRLAALELLLAGDEENEGLRAAYEQAKADYNEALKAYVSLQKEFLKVTVEYAKEYKAWQDWAAGEAGAAWEAFKDDFNELEDDDAYKVAVLEKLGENYTDKELYDAMVEVGKLFTEMVNAANSAEGALDRFAEFIEESNANTLKSEAGKEELAELYEELKELLEEYDRLFGTNMAADMEEKYQALLTAINAGNNGNIDTAKGAFLAYANGNGLRNAAEDKEKLEITKLFNAKMKNGVFDSGGKEVIYGYVLDKSDKNAPVTLDQFFMLNIEKLKKESGKVPVYATEEDRENGTNVTGYAETQKVKSTETKVDKNGNVTTKDKDMDATFLYDADGKPIGSIIPYKDETDLIGKEKATLTLAPGTSITMLYCTKGSDFHIGIFTNNTDEEMTWDLHFHYHNTGITFNDITNLPDFNVDLGGGGLYNVPDFVSQPESIKGNLVKFGLPNPQKITNPTEYLAWLERANPEFYEDLLDELSGLTAPEFEALIEEIITGGGGGGGGSSSSTTSTTPTPVTTTVINDSPVPLAMPPEEDELTVIMDDDVPLANLPRTGGVANAFGPLFGLVGAFSLGIAGLKKKGK